MISHPFLLAAFLLAVEAGVLWLASYSKTKHFFNIIPSVFWMYALPMMASSAGLIDAKSPLYPWVTKYILPASLFILLMRLDIRGIFKLGPTALAIFG